MHAIDDQLALAKLQYEILNVSVSSLANSLGRTPAMMQAHIDNEGWVQLWPEETHIEYDDDGDEETDSFSVISDDYIENAKKRLTIYSLAKETLLTHKYAELELGIISRAKEILDETIDTPSISSIKALATLYKDMTKDFAAARNNVATKDISGIPSVIIKDLSGQRP